MGVVFTKRCVLCGKYLPASKDKACLCGECALELGKYRLKNTSVYIPNADGAAAALRYTGSVKNAMRAFKFLRKQSNAEWFAAQMFPLLAERLDIWKPDIITFAPIGFMRYRKRGYNQSELLAKAIAKLAGLPCRGTLKKRPFAKQQSKRKDAEARWKNSEKLFLPVKNQNLSGMRVLFVDDIITTGATADSAAKLLKEMGAECVYVIAPIRA